MNTQTLELDLSKDGLGGNVVRVGQGDSKGTTLKAYIYDSGAEASLAGYTGFLEVLLPNKRNYYRAACTVSGNTATVVLDESKLCCVAGYTDEAYFTFEKSGAKYSTERFAIEILRCVTDGMQPAESWDDAINDIVKRGNAAVSAANEAAGSANSAASAANAAADRVDDSIAAAESATEAATNAAAAASSAASAATSAAGSANSAASAAQSAATSANSAAGAAQSATTAATDAAAAANGAAERVEQAIDDAESATDAANTAASKADGAAEEASAAADDARDAAKRALSAAGAAGAGSGASGGGGASSEEVEQLKRDTATLARALAEATDKYVIVDEICFVPSSRYESLEDGVLSLSGASYADDVLTLA